MSTYPRIAWATAMTPSSTEHYQNLLKHKVKDVVICLHLSGFKKYETGEIHTKVARETGMRIHAGLITNLANPLEDTRCFYRAYRELNYTSDAKVSIFCLKTYVVTNREKRLQELLRYLSCFIDKENIDVAFNKADLTHHFNQETVKDYNLTVFNPGGLNAGIKNAGTWIYSNTLESNTQYLGYDFYGFYTGNKSYQLSLDNEYIARPGDTWVTVATRHNIWLPKLLKLNNAQYKDLVVPGQIIKIT